MHKFDLAQMRNADCAPLIARSASRPPTIQRVDIRLQLAGCSGFCSAAKQQQVESALAMLLHSSLQTIALINGAAAAVLASKSSVDSRMSHSAKHRNSQ